MQTSLGQLVGQDVGGYRVERLIGRGHVNAIYLAYHARQNSPVALVLFILPEKLSFEARQYFLLRFRQEATRLTSLQHSHILPVYDYGEYAGYPYLVTPYMTNGSLADVLKHRARFDHADVLDVLPQAVAGLVYAHGKGVFHGALKPANIVLDKQQILVSGFGLTQILQMRGVERDKRPYGHLFSIAGTFLTAAEYLAPEVVQGQPADARTDVYSLGMILFELLSGKTPFTGAKPLEIAMQHVQQPVPLLRTYRPDLPLALAAVVNQALDRDPARRFQRVDELAEAFAQVSTALSERDANNTVRTARRSLELQETPAVGYVFGNWQLSSPVITEKVVAVKPTFQETNRQELPRSVTRSRTSVPSSEDVVASAILPTSEPVVTGSSSQAAVFDLWTASPQEALTPYRADSVQQNTSRSKRGLTSRPFRGLKAREDERVSRRKVVALLGVAGVAIAGGTAVVLNLARQQAQNNAANLAKNAALNFMHPANNKANVLVHLADGNFVAYDRACTHVGVYVNYDPVKQLLVCPAHGATFDPARAGAVVQGVLPQGPDIKPLPMVAVRINADGTIVPA